jgi:NhaP-type Na+/H+ or K+/H+ antiporter
MRNPLAKTASGVLALAGVLFAYGAIELVEGYGFIAAFVSGLTLRRAEVGHEFYRRLHSFSEAIEHALTAILLLLIGGALPLLWPELDWRHVTIALALMFLIRPIAGWISLSAPTCLAASGWWLRPTVCGASGRSITWVMQRATCHSLMKDSCGRQSPLPF